MVEMNPDAGPWQAFSPFQRGGFLAVLFLVGAASTMDRAVLSILLEQLKYEFALSDSMLGLLTGAPFGLCYALSSIPLARLADRHGRKRVLFWASAAWAVMTGLCGLATTLPFLIIARMGVGLAEGGAIAPSHALIADYFGPRHRASALAMFTASGTVGTLIASSIGGWIAQAYGWRESFLAMAAISLPISLLVLGVLREPGKAESLERGEVRHEFRTDIGTLLRKPAFVAVLVGLLFYAVMPFSVIIFTPAYLIRIMGLTMAQAGSLFGLATGLGSIIGSLVGGVLADRLRRIDEAWLLRIPALIMVIELGVSVTAFTVRNVTPFLLLHATSTALLYAMLPSVFATVQHICGSTRRAIASATTFLVLNALGVTFAPIALGLLSDAFVSSTGPEALRYAMITISLAVIPAALAFGWGARSVAACRED